MKVISYGILMIEKIKFDLEYIIEQLTDKIVCY